MIKPIDDLQKYYKIGEILNFNAVQAPTNSRAKWKVIHLTPFLYVSERD